MKKKSSPYAGHYLPEWTELETVAERDRKTSENPKPTGSYLRAVVLGFLKMTAMEQKKHLISGFSEARKRLLKNRRDNAKST